MMNLSFLLWLFSANCEAGYTLIGKYNETSAHYSNVDSSGQCLDVIFDTGVR